MKIGKTKLICILSLVPLLMSAATPTVYTSEIAGKTCYENEIEGIVSKGTKSYSGTSNGPSNRNVAMSIQVDYELFKMGHNFMYTSWDTIYSLLYRIHVDIKSSYQYKTGWWLWEETNTVMPFLSEITTKLEISGIENNYKVVSESPYIEDGSGFDGNYVKREDGLDMETTCGGMSTYNGGYFFTPVNYFDASRISASDDLFFSRKKTSKNTTTYSSSTYSYYDTNIQHAYTDMDVYYFGGFSLVSNNAPTSIKLGFNVVCGGTKENKLNCNYMGEDGSSDQLDKYEVNKLISKGYAGKIIKRNYDNLIKSSDSITIR